MKYENYRLPGGKTLSAVTFEDIRWQYGVFRCNSTGTGRDKKYFPWRAVKTKLGEIEECDWCKLVEAVIERENEIPLLNALIQWCNEHNYVSASVSEMRKEALQLHASRIFDNPQWIGFIPFNAKYRPEILNTANIVFVRMACCPEAGAVTQEQIDRACSGQISCPHCGRWNSFTILERGFVPGTYLLPHFTIKLCVKHLILTINPFGKCSFLSIKTIRLNTLHQDFIHLVVGELPGTVG